MIAREALGTRRQALGDEEVILAKAWHEEFGGPHAEVVAIERVMAEIRNQKPETRNLKEVTLFVNLEPCCAHGKTPPCTDAILKSGIQRVVFGARDPSNPGADILRKSGVEVIGPVLEPECRRFNRGFFSLIEKNRPWVTVKKALYRDGSVPSAHVTSDKQDRWTHARLRATHDAILVGSGTVIADNPKLTVRTPTAYQVSRSTYQARRIILDPYGEIPPTAHVLTDEDAGRTIVIREKLPIPALLERLRGEGVASVLVEGGPRIWKSFEESGCVDEMVILVGR
jgi:diaminohydroxyphosphoribosylaminopyrimidine deaminase/5-amino-6-(5-phosphoribosylamino)uracil reductase